LEHLDIFEAADLRQPVATFTFSTKDFQGYSVKTP
jgi:hypothetical protein